MMILFSLANIKQQNPSVQKYEVHVLKMKYTFIPAALQPPVASLTKFTRDWLKAHWFLICVQLIAD